LKPPDQSRAGAKTAPNPADFASPDIEARRDGEGQFVGENFARWPPYRLGARQHGDRLLVPETCVAGALPAPAKSVAEH